MGRMQAYGFSFDHGLTVDSASMHPMHTNKLTQEKMRENEIRNQPENHQDAQGRSRVISNVFLMLFLHCRLELPRQEKQILKSLVL